MSCGIIAKTESGPTTTGNASPKECFNAYLFESHNSDPKRNITIYFPQKYCFLSYFLYIWRIGKIKKPMRISAIIRLLAMASIAAAVWSCSSEQNYFLPEPELHQSNYVEYPVTISAGHVADTRTYLDLNDPQNGAYPYYWEPGDQVGLTAAIAGTSSIVWNNVELTNDEAVMTSSATFTGALTESQWSAMDSGESYDYYSWYPSDLVGSGLSISFTTPTVLTPGTFVPDAPMIARATDERPIVYPVSSESYDDPLHLEYQHVMSYIAIEYYYPGPTNQILTRIAVSTDNPNDKLWGTFSCDLATGNLAGGTNNTVFDIYGGVSSGPNGGVLYLPVAPGNYSGSDFTFTFTYSNDTQAVKTIPGSSFQRAAIHSLVITTPAVITQSGNFVTKPGYYYIETWGGDGGNGGKVGGGNEGVAGAGGKGLRQAGLFYFSGNTTLYVQVGTAGGNGGNGVDGSTFSNVPGGSGGSGGVGQWFGSGHAGGAGGNSPSGTSYNSGSGGGGGGSASGVLSGGIGVPNIIIASGGGGGGGGNSDNRGGNGGDSGAPGDQAPNDSNNGPGGNDWDENNTNGIYGAYNIVGKNASVGPLRRGSGGGGGGGGGFDGQSGGGGQSGVGGAVDIGNGTGLDVKSGGGGAGGGSAVRPGVAVSNPGYLPLPSNSRPDGRRDGYVVITYFRPLQ